MMDNAELVGCHTGEGCQTYLSTHGGKVLIRRVSESGELNACSRLVLLELASVQRRSKCRGDLGNLLARGLPDS